MTWLTRQIAMIEEAFTVACLIAIAVIINLQIFRRYFLNDPYIWPEEVIRITMIWLSFVGAGIGFRRGAHITVDTLVQMLPAGWRIAALDISDLAVTAVFAIVGIEARQLAVVVSDAPMPATNLPTSMIVWPLVVLSVQAILYSLTRIYVRHAKGLEAVETARVLE
jgi:TRAP-type C4-dicarboxylate transport system permease small subunit